MKSYDESLGSDLLRGAGPISEFIEEPLRRTFYLLENKQIPAGKLGNTWIASKTKLRDHFRRLTGGDAA
jgi:hypothetical protein